MAFTKLSTAVLVLTLASSSLLTVSAKLSNPVSQWLVATQKTVADLGLPNQIAGRYYAFVALSQYKALKVLQSDAAYKKALPSAKKQLQTAVQAYAAHTVLSESFPWRQTATYDVLLKNHTTAIHVSTAAVNFAEGLAVPLTRKFLASRVGDGSTRWARFSKPTTKAVGAYQFTPNQTTALYPQLGGVKPIGVDPAVFTKAIKSAIAQKHTIPSVAYYKELDFVAAQGIKKSATRSKYNTDSPTFWADGNTTSAIGGHFLTIAYEVLPSNLDLLSTARIFAQATVAAYDASIAAWSVKYQTLFWRPITALRAGDKSRKAIPNWTPLLSTPAHPEFPSGHQATVGGFLAVLQAAVGDKVTFKVGSEGLHNVTRTYKSLSAAALEVGDSRSFGGLHFPRSNAVGLQLGVTISKNVLKYLDQTL